MSCNTVCLSEAFFKTYTTHDIVDTVTDDLGQVRILTNQKGQPIYVSTGNTIRAKIEKRVVSVFTPSRSTWQTINTIWTNTALKIGDRVEGLKVTHSLDYGEYECR